MGQLKILWVIPNSQPQRLCQHMGCGDGVCTPALPCASQPRSSAPASSKNATFRPKSSSKSPPPYLALSIHGSGARRSMGRLSPCLSLDLYHNPEWVREGEKPTLTGLASILHGALQQSWQGYCCVVQGSTAAQEALGLGVEFDSQNFLASHYLLPPM